MSDYTDMVDRQLQVGDIVIYTTSERGSGLQRGEVIELYESKPQWGNLKTKKVKIQPVLSDNTPKTRFESRYNPDGSYTRFDTGKCVRSTHLEYHPNKFYIVSR